MKIGCDVENCSHNKSGTCYSNRVNMEGSGAKDSCSTCCATFLDERNYSTLTNNTSSSGSCDCLVCDVTNCRYNNNKMCKSENIVVSGSNVNLYIETHCDTFKAK
ncbi:DUF1540 domain-containing protein [Romboutsia sp.]|uniref:DUF1540 domain-containing protein n=1 Tax=Romboutsia sp. TaxID=1965302 RepID=UPI003F399C88